VMGDGEPKYLNSPETEIFDKSRNLYGLNYARSSRRKGILLCEGYMDVIALHQAGFDNPVAALGTSFTSGHASLLKRYTDEVFLTFDSDNAGIKAALRAIPILKEAGITAKVINMNPYKDPDEFIKNLGADAYEERIRQAENSFLFEVRSLESDYNLDDPEEKTAFHKKIARMILRFPDELERENYITAIAEKYHTGFDNLRSLVRAEGTRGGIAVKKPPLKSGIKQPEKKDGIRLSQRLLLTWLVDEPDLFPTVMQYISPEDFTDPLYHEVAEEIYQQYKNGELHPVTIMNRFEEEDKQKEIAAIFHEKLPPFSTEQEKEVAFRDTIIKIKKNHIDTQMQQSTSLEQYQELIKEKQKLDMLRTRKLI
jgi:DNA primase